MKKLAFYSIERSNEISESYIKKLVEKLRKNIIMMLLNFKMIKNGRTMKKI